MQLQVATLWRSEAGGLIALIYDDAVVLLELLQTTKRLIEKSLPKNQSRCLSWSLEFQIAFVIQ